MTGVVKWQLKTRVEDWPSITTSLGLIYSIRWKCCMRCICAIICNISLSFEIHLLSRSMLTIWGLSGGENIPISSMISVKKCMTFYFRRSYGLWTHLEESTLKTLCTTYQPPNSKFECHFDVFESVSRYEESLFLLLSWVFLNHQPKGYVNYPPHILIAISCLKLPS